LTWFLYLIKACKPFHEVTKSPELNRKAPFGETSDPEAVNSFLEQRGQHIWNLEFVNVKNTSKLLRTAAMACTSLRSLRVSGDIFPGLTDLHLYGQNFDDETMALMLENRY
jgi:hypothetical protein